jgi:hypothetical protein
MKTAIEQFVKDFYLYAEPYAYSIEEDKWVISEKDFEYLISKAKKIEKERIINAVTWGGLHESAEQYYKETFNSK